MFTRKDGRRPNPNESRSVALSVGPGLDLDSRSVALTIGPDVVNDSRSLSTPPIHTDPISFLDL